MKRLLLISSVFCWFTIHAMAQYGLDVDGQVNFERTDNLTQRVRIITQGPNADALLQFGTGGGVDGLIGWNGGDTSFALVPGLVLNSTGFNIKKEKNPNNNSANVNFSFGSKTTQEDKVLITNNSELGFPHLNLQENGTSDYARLQFSGNGFENKWTIAAGLESAEVGPMLHFIHKPDASSSASRVVTIDGDDRRLGVWDHSPDRRLSVNHESISNSSIWVEDEGFGLKNVGTAEEGGVDDYEWLFHVKGAEFGGDAGDLVLLSSYFNGSSYLRGTFDGTSGVYTSSSDRRLKKNIKYLSKEKTTILAKIQRLKPASYQFKNQRSNRTHLGLIAQEVQKVFPESVNSVSDDPNKEILGIAYSTLIPVLIAGMQEQQAQLIAKDQQFQELEKGMEQLQKEIAEIRSLLQKEGAIKKQDLKNENNSTNIVLQKDYLTQNSPNPFHINTTIRYQLPKNTTNAMLRITNIQGQLVKDIVLNNQTQGKIELEKGTLEKGIYTYSILVNGQIIDSKKMVLTE